jgi:hypothetical protein
MLDATANDMRKLVMRASPNRCSIHSALVIRRDGSEDRGGALTNDHPL